MNNNELIMNIRSIYSPKYYKLINTFIQGIIGNPKTKLLNLPLNPLESEIAYRPSWYDKKFNNIVPRSVTQKKIKEYWYKNPTINISSDAGILQTQGFTRCHAEVKVSLVVYSIHNLQIKADFISLNTTDPEKQLIEMNILEIGPLICAMLRIRGERPYCEQDKKDANLNRLLNKKDCLCRKIDWKQFSNYVDIFITPDRSLLKYNFNKHDFLKNSLKKLQDDFFTYIIYTKSKAYSYYHSQQKPIIESVIHSMSNWRNILQQPGFSNLIIEWLLSNSLQKQFTKGNKRNLFSFIDTNISNMDYENTNFKNFLDEVVSYLDSYKLLLNDYYYIKKRNAIFEERTCSFELNKSSLKQNVNFFYLNYCISWARVEFFNCEVDEIYHNCLGMTSYSKYFYPFHLELAHHHAVIKDSTRRALSKYISRIYSVYPTNKNLMKI